LWDETVKKVRRKTAEQTADVTAEMFKEIPEKSDSQ